MKLSSPRPYLLGTALLPSPYPHLAPTHTINPWLVQIWSFLFIFRHFCAETTRNEPCFLSFLLGMSGNKVTLFVYPRNKNWQKLFPLSLQSGMILVFNLSVDLSNLIRKILLARTLSTQWSIFLTQLNSHFILSSTLVTSSTCGVALFKFFFQLEYLLLKSGDWRSKGTTVDGYINISTPGCRIGIPSQRNKAQDVLRTFITPEHHKHIMLHVQCTTF